MKLFTRLSAAFHESHPSYSGKTSSELLDCFYSTNWARYKQDEKLAILQEFENRFAASGGREPAVVLASNDPSLAGAYSSKGNRIWINLQNSNSYDVLDSLVHEANHAQQAYDTEYRPQRYDEHIGGMIRAENARSADRSMYNYAQPSKYNHNYDMQCNELDSNIKAAVFLLNQNERFRDDTVYRDYLSARQKHFREVNNAIVAEAEGRREMQLHQIDAATAHGDLSEQQRNKLTANLSNPEFEDKTVTESCRVEQWISEDLDALERKESCKDTRTNVRMDTAAVRGSARPFSRSRASATKSPEEALQNLDEGIRNWQSFWTETAQELKGEMNAVQLDPQLSEERRFEQLQSLEHRWQYLSQVYEQERAELTAERQTLAEQVPQPEPMGDTASSETSYEGGEIRREEEFLPAQAEMERDCADSSTEYGIDVSPDETPGEASGTEYSCFEGTPAESDHFETQASPYSVDSDFSVKSDETSFSNDLSSPVHSATDGESYGD